MWAAEWYSYTVMEESKHLIHENGLPVLFRTKRESAAYIKERYGYIATRKDLRAEPHGWRMPKPIKVVIVALEKR